jgi:hypothetical protein
VALAGPFILGFLALLFDGLAAAAIVFGVTATVFVIASRFDVYWH